MRNILCLSTSNYDPIPTRKQNVMNRMTDAKVVYVDPPVTWIAPFRDRSARMRLSAFRAGGVQRLPHVRVYPSPPVLPFFNKVRAINRCNQRRMAQYLASIVHENGFGTDFYLWCYSPVSADVVEPLAYALGMEPEVLWSRTIYDCVDRHSAYPGLIDPAVVDGMEEDLARHASTVFATAEGLAQRLARFNENTHFIPNGANYELFSSVREYTPDPDRPLTFGFVGMLQECIDYEAIASVARAFPEGRVVLIGGSLPGVDFGALEGLANVERTGLVPQDGLPQLIADFHVCLNVFEENELSRHVSPLKFYEYLATGKPIVSTPYPLQVRAFEGCIYLADTVESFVEQCRKAALEREDDPKRLQRMERARQNSWESRIAEMRTILNW